MFAASDPNLIIGGMAVGGLMIAALWRLIVWVRDAPARPDPWDAEVEKQLSEPDAVEVCPHCLTEQPPAAWFCRKCGRAVGPYNNLMPYVMVFSQGEALRNGVSGRVRNRPLVLIGFALIALSTSFIFAPICLFLLLANWRRSGRGPEAVEEPKNP
jgi:ribosomal protein L40E